MLRNVAWVAMASYLEAAGGLIAGVLIARTLGPSDYGHYAFGIWLCGVLIMASNNGLPLASIKFLAEVRGSGRVDMLPSVVSHFVRLQWVCSALVMALFVVAMTLNPIDDWLNALPLMLTIAVVGSWARAGYWMWGAISIGHELFVPKNLSLALMALVNVVLVALLAWRNASIAQFFMLYAMLGLAANLLLRWMLARHGVASAAGHIPAELTSRVRRHVLLTGLMALLFLCTNRGIEMALLKLYDSAESVAYFAIASALTKGAVDLLAGGLSAVLLPAMSRQFGAGGTAAMKGMLVESTRLYWMVGLAIAGLGLTVSEGLVHLLYDHRYEGAIPILTGTLVAAGLTVVGGAAAAALTAGDRYSDRMRAIVGVLLVNLTVALLLIPRYGLSGAVASLVMAQIADAVLNWYFVFRRQKVGLPLRPMAFQALAAVVATTLGWLTTEALHVSAAFVGGAAVFLLAYVPLCVMLRTLRAAEFEVVAHIVGRLGRRAESSARWIAGLRRFALPDTLA